MTDSPHDLAAVEQLLAERDALHAWLGRLEGAAGAAPESVRERVRRDYERRLEQLTNGLRAHADTIGLKLAEDRAEHAELESRALAAREALAEAELRHMVGEYETSRFEAERTRHTSDLETFDHSLRAAGERIARLEEVHAVVTRAPRPIDASTVATAPVATSEVEAIVLDEETLTIDELAPDRETDALLSIFDEPVLSTIESDDPDDGASKAPEQPETQDTPRESGASVSGSQPLGGFGPLSFRPSGSPSSDSPRAAPASPRGPLVNTPPIGMPGVEPPRFVRPGERLPRTSTPPVERQEAAAQAPSGALFREEIVASGPAPETATAPVGRTLRCGECGAMNKPLDWYCEKCGAELTAL